MTHVTPAQEHVITGEEVAEHIEMGGRAAREKLAMKLPKFGQPQTVRPARRTDSLLNEVVPVMMLILLTRRLSFNNNVVTWFVVHASSAITSRKVICTAASSRSAMMQAAPLADLPEDARLKAHLDQ